MLISRGKKGRNESCVSRYLQQQCKHRREGNMIRIIFKKKKKKGAALFETRAISRPSGIERNLFT